MDALRVGRSLRALRVRRELRQTEVAARATISRSQVSRIETGAIDRVPIGDLLALATALGADLDIRVRWHGDALDRLLDAAHAGLVDRVVRLLTTAGWECAVEVSFNVYGERGAIDLLARRGDVGALLVVEVKSVVPDAQAMVAAHDRKARLEPVIARERGWEATAVGRLLIVGEGTTSRRRIAGLRALFDAAYPDRVATVRRWIREPAGSLSGLVFLPLAHSMGTRKASAGERRIRPSKRRSNHSA